MMKNLTLGLITFLLIGMNYLSAETDCISDAVKCNWESWFKYPEKNKTYYEGEDIYVRLDCKKYQDIEWVECYINGKLVRKESSWPYEWCKKGSSGDSYLRKMRKGTYKIECKIRDKCGEYHKVYHTITVKTKGGGYNQCAYDVKFKYPQKSNYYAGDDVYVALTVDNYKHIKHCELYINDRLVRKESKYPYEWAKKGYKGDDYLRKMSPGNYKLKCKVYDNCGKYKEYYHNFTVKGGGHADNGHGNCKYKSWFKYPKNNSSYKYGKDVYVRVDTEKYQDIAEMHLYVNNKFVRKESQYPYEWCKGTGNNDRYLRKLNKGTYKLKCRVKTKCGKWHEYYSTFHVK